LKQKSGYIHLYEQLSQFFKNNFPSESFSLEIEKREAIDALLKSGNFARTHSAVALLESYVDFLTDAEAEEIIHSSLENNQVVLIMSDADVKNFFNHLIMKHGDSITAAVKDRLQAALGNL
jgi:hypothetical protein